MKRILLLASLCCALAAPVQATVAPHRNPLAQEPLYASIVLQAESLRLQTDAFALISSRAWLQTPEFGTYAAAIRDLAANDLKGHFNLKSRGTDNDLKCILKGVSLDLGLKLDALKTSETDAEVGSHLKDLSLLLSDNIDVIVTPATADSGMDCVIEFGPGA